MARMYKALCLRSTVMDNPYKYFKAGEKYTVEEGWPVLAHFQRIGAELPAKEAERIQEEGPPVQRGKRK